MKPKNQTEATLYLAMLARESQLAQIRDICVLRKMTGDAVENENDWLDKLIALINSMLESDCVHPDEMEVEK